MLTEYKKLQQKIVLELAKAAANETVVLSPEMAAPVAGADGLGPSIPFDPSHDEIPSQERDSAQVQAHASPKHDMHVIGMVDATELEFTRLQGNSNDSVNGTAVENVTSTDIVEEDLAAKDHQNIVEDRIQGGLLTKPEDAKETAEDGWANEDMQVSSIVDVANLQDS